MACESWLHLLNTICSVAAFGPSSAEDANHASFPCLVSQELPQTNLYEIRC